MSGRATRRGLFISIEGGDGAGKSSQIARLEKLLAQKGHDVIVTREPGGTKGGEKIRALLVRGEAGKWSALTEALLMYAARADHLERVIRPALQAGKTVVTDRFADSTMAYQGIAGGLGEERVRALRDLVVEDNEPDLTLILDLPTEIGLSRAGGRAGEETRFESKGSAFQEEVRQAFLKIARENADRCVVIDARPDEETVAHAIAEALEKALQSKA